MDPAVIISNGNSKFILGAAAAEAERRGILATLVTAGYPTPRIKRLAKKFPFSSQASVQRLLEREEKVPIDKVYPIWSSELFDQAANMLRSFPVTRSAAELVSLFALKAYQSASVKGVGLIEANIYHYRSGYGGNSVAEAKKRGLIALCDHSIAHPAVLEHLVANGGQLPTENKKPFVNAFWTEVLRDIDQGDHVIVNSQFVKETFLRQGWSYDNVHVAYTGVDDAFIEFVRSDRSYTLEATRPLRLLFAGDFGRRKGANFLIAALQSIRELQWTIEIVGNIHPDIAEEHAAFLTDPRVDLLGYISRTKLAERMSAADVFVFPSLAEGSARVVFFALACGCYVVTTPNSGSIVEDDVHGSLIPAGDAHAIEDALRKVDANRSLLAEVGPANADLVRRRYRQTDYGSALASIYRRVMLDNNLSKRRS